MTRPRRICLLQVGEPEISSAVFAYLADHLTGAFEVPVEVGLPLTLNQASCRPERSEGPAVDADLQIPRAAGDDTPDADLQIPRAARDDTMAADALLDALIAYAPDAADHPATWYLGLTALDLSAPGRNCVFGEATVGGAWGLVGVARFGAAISASPRLLERTLKESLHELGHLGGLSHCTRAGCAMTRAATVAEVDTKKPEICDSCATRLFEKERLDRSEKPR